MPSEKYTNPDISLVFLGDSVTAELLVDEEKRFPYLTGVLLEKEMGIKINSYNVKKIGFVCTLAYVDKEFKEKNNNSIILFQENHKCIVETDTEDEETA